MLKLLLVSRKFAELVESHSIELGGIGPVLGVLVDWMGADGCGVTLWNCVASASAQAFGIGDDSGNVDCATLVRRAYASKYYIENMSSPSEGGFMRWDSRANESSFWSFGSVALSILPPSPTTSITSCRSSWMYSGYPARSYMM